MTFHRDGPAHVGLSTDPYDVERREMSLAELDAKYHDHLPYGTNCGLCGVDHAAVWPSAICARCGDTFDDHRVSNSHDHGFVALPKEDR